MFMRMDDFLLHHIFSFVNDFTSKVRMTNVCQRFAKLKNKITEIGENDKINGENYKLVSHYNITTIYYHWFLGSIYKKDLVNSLVDGCLNLTIPITLENVDMIEIREQKENKLVFDKLYFKKGYTEKFEHGTSHVGDKFTITGRVYRYIKKMK